MRADAGRIVARCAGLLATVATFVCCATPAFATDPTWDGSVFTYTSAAGDYIGQGHSGSITSGFYVSAPGGNPVDAGNVDIQTVGDGNGDEFADWSIDLAAPPGETLHNGVYAGAVRAAFRPTGTPGIDVTEYDRGCDETFGSFTINDIQISAAGSIERLSADFEQHCEKASGPALEGHLDMVNSLAPPEDLPEVPLPALLIPCAGLAGAVLIRRRRRNPTSRPRSDQFPI